MPILSKATRCCFHKIMPCEDCGINIEEITPRMFSFNNPYGACPTCMGLGSKLEIDPDQIIPNKNLSIMDGAIKASGWGGIDPGSISRMYFDAIAQKYGFKMTDKIKDLPKDGLNAILYGTKGEKLELFWRARRRRRPL